MSTYYVDLSVATSGHGGNSGDPWGSVDLLATSLLDGDNLLVKGIKDIGVVSAPSCFTAQVHWDKWVGVWGSDPWRLRVDAGGTEIDFYTSFHNGILSVHNMGSAYPDGWRWFGPISQDQVNMVFISEDIFSDAHPAIYFGSYDLTHNIKGCTFIVPGSGLYAGLYVDGGAGWIDCVIDTHLFNPDIASCGTITTANCAFSCPQSGEVTPTSCQFNWTPPTWPAWNATKELWAESINAAGILSGTGHPEPGNGYPTYAGYSTDPWGNARDGIGALYMGFTPPPITSLSYFDSSSVVTGAFATSNINVPGLVTAIQADSPDDYFDSTSEVDKVIVYYTSPDGRQLKRITHNSPSFTGPVAWFATARDGTWQKTRIRAFDADGASHNLYRAAIGTSEDVVHIDGTVHLNVS
jgi:hypothetical protein